MDTLSLNGTWQIEIAGVSGSVEVPAAWETQGYPDMEGPALYHKEIVIPESWQGRRVCLEFGAVSYYTEVMVNRVLVGTHEGLWTPFYFDISTHLRYGEINRIELRITKPADDGDRFPYRDVLVGFIPYVSTTFGGIWQDVELIAYDRAWIEHLHLTPDTGLQTLTLRFNMKSIVDVQLIAYVTDAEGQTVTREMQGASAGSHEITLHVPNPHLWSPAQPELYTLVLQLEHDGQMLMQVERRFGFRTLSNVGERLLLNDSPVFLRGILSWGWNPATLAPIFSEDEIRAEFRRLRGLGFNLYKLCLYIPPPRLFEIADEEGMLLWLEMPMWLPRLSEYLRAQAVQEYTDILAQVHHHPSIVIYSLGCELSAEMADSDLLERLDGLTRNSTCGVLVCDNSGSGEAYGGLVQDFSDFNDYHFYADLHYFTPLCNHFRRDWRTARPWIFGEFCDCDDFRAVDELERTEDYHRWQNYLGKDGGIHRWAYRDQLQRVEALNLPFSNNQLMQLSRQTSFVVRKTILEKVRGRRDIQGYVITGLRDTPISTSGMFDDLGRFKYDEEAFRNFNNDIVLLIDQGRARQWTHGGDRPAPQDLYNYLSGASVSIRLILACSSQTVSGGELIWSLQDGLEVVHQNNLPVSAAAYSPVEIVSIDFTLPTVTSAKRFTFRAVLRMTGREITNEWSMWVYPQADLATARIYDPIGVISGLKNGTYLTRMPEGKEVLIATLFTPEVESYVREGGRVMVLQSGVGMLPVQPVPFWRESIKLFYEHPVMTAFPHEGFADLQFYNLASDFAFDSQALAQQFTHVTPVMRRLDARLFTALDYIVEAQLGAGRMLLSTLRFSGGSGDQVQDLSANPAAQFLLGKMVNYLVTV